jgi:hypothetical protein
MTKPRRGEYLHPCVAYWVDGEQKDLMTGPLYISNYKYARLHLLRYENLWAA